MLSVEDVDASVTAVEEMPGVESKGDIVVLSATGAELDVNDDDCEAA